MLTRSRFPRVADRTADGFKAYENEDDATKDLAEFSLANAIYAALVEGHACEQSARCVHRVSVPSPPVP